MSNKLTGIALKVYRAIDDGIWGYASGIKREKAGELAEVPSIELLPGLFYYAVSMARLEKLAIGDLIEMLRHAWELYENHEPGPVELDNVVGRTISRIERSNVEGQWGPELLITFYFTDGTHTGIVPALD